MQEPAAFEHALRVYWEDTDAGGIVYYANYLKFFERARTEWLRALGVGQQEMADAEGAMFVVTQAQLRYLSPARLDDPLRITVCPVEIGRASLQMNQGAWRAGTLLCEARVQIACVDRGTLRPRRIPTELFARINA